ncbi:hypothetical protein NDU88_001158 [Pleurodeles waltl]|uniref:Uncharacterized protein n=1 Tax=Pleurodeles waltl TaxID=8319 RepID=A0AAV7THI4_PLEWA|nr:hypothetical protein NDU88_001158 [Pleurodeles waltl]
MMSNIDDEEHGPTAKSDDSMRSGSPGPRTGPEQNLALNKPRYRHQRRSQHQRTPEQKSEQWQCPRSSKKEENANKLRNSQNPRWRPHRETGSAKVETTKLPDSETRSREHSPSHQAEEGKEQPPNSLTEQEAQNSSTNVSGEDAELGGLKVRGRKDTWATRHDTNGWLRGAVRPGTTAPSWNPTLGSAGRSRLQRGTPGGCKRRKAGTPANESGITTWPRGRGEPG